MPAKKKAPAKKAAKKTTAKKAAAKKAVTKKIAKKSTPKKAPAKKAAAKKAPKAPAKKKAAAKKAPAKKSAPKKVAPKKVAKKAVKKAAAKKAAKIPAKKKAAAKKSPVKKPAPQKVAPKKVAKKAVKKAAAKKAAKAPAKKAAAKKTSPKDKAQTSKKTLNTKSQPTVSSSGFSLEEALKVAKTRKSEDDGKAAKKAAKEKEKRAIEKAEQNAKSRVLGAASLADILGQGSTASIGAPSRNGQEVPRKYKVYYDLLIELRDHVSAGLNLHTEDTLKRSSKDDAGDLSGYSQHMADAGTDTFDRDFALSMVSNEQEALTEVEEAINRIYDGTYGICEMTGKPISKERLMAVPFTRYSVETQAQLEQNQVKSVQRGGAFADATGDTTLSFGDENPDA